MYIFGRFVGLSHWEADTEDFSSVLYAWKLRDKVLTSQSLGTPITMQVIKVCGGQKGSLKAENVLDLLII